MITAEQNRALITVGTIAAKNKAWTHYANYCFEKEKGKRKEALHEMDKFLEAASRWSTEATIDFLNFIFPLFENIPEANYGPFPQPLSKKLVEPALDKWCKTSPSDSNPFRWYGRFYKSKAHLEKAITINPTDDLARSYLIEEWMALIDFSLHHFPECFIGNPADSIAVGERVQLQIEQLISPALKKGWTEKLTYSLHLIQTYINWEASGHPHLELWAAENNINIVDVDNTVYYFNTKNQ
nr:hypothetical protein [uncultured Sediminibacterium sp.]